MAKSKKKPSPKDKDMKRKKGSHIWSIPGLEKRCRELILEGILEDSDGVGALCDDINKEFEEKLAAIGAQATKRTLSSHLPELIWTPTVLKELKSAIQHRKDIKQFWVQYYSYIPETLFREKIKYLTGVSKARESARFVAGVGRLITDDLGPDADRFTLPKYDYKKPMPIEAGKEWQILFLNGSNVGTRHNRIIEDNPSRCLLSDAQKRKAVAVIITNGVDLDLKKTAGSMKIRKAQTSGIRINLEHLPQSYRKEAARIIKQNRNDEIVFQSISARFLGVLDGWHKITHRPNGKPEYDGPVYYVFGYKEEDLIVEAANAEIRYIWIRKQKSLRAETSVVSRMLKAAERSLDRDSLTEEKHKAITTKIEELAKRKEELTEELALAILTNVSDDDRNRHRRRIRALVVKKFEETIPNCKVISQGTTFIKVGEHSKPIEINIPSHERVTDSLLANYGDSYGAKVLRDTLAETVVICHPYALNHRLVGRDDSENGKRKSAIVHVAPICVDDGFLRDQLRNATRIVHPLHKAVCSDQFKSGVLILNCVNDTVTGDLLPIAKLDKTKTSKNFAFPYPETKYIWIEVHTDDHFGSRAKEYIWNPKQRKHLGMTESVVEMMRCEGIVNDNDMPVHMISNNDDATQGNHFETHKQPDPREISNLAIQERLERASDTMRRMASKGNIAGVMELMGDTHKFTMEQFLVRGLDWLQHQMLEVFERQLEESVDFYDAVLSRAVKSGLILRGVSKFNGVPFDSRDVGFINRGTGNHFERTVDRTLTEGVFYAKYIRSLLAQLPNWKDKKDFLETAVCAPLFSNQYFGLGTVKAPKGYEYGLRFLSSPARQDSWSDTLKAMVKSDIRRGDSTYGVMKGRTTLTTMGDKHFLAMVNTAFGIYVMGPAGTHTDLYGERGFPPNNTGVVFIGLPTDGPDAGPVLIRPLMFDYVRDWFANPKPFNWDKFLPNPV